MWSLVVGVCREGEREGCGQWVWLCVQGVGGGPRAVVDNEREAEGTEEGGRRTGNEKHSTDAPRAVSALPWRLLTSAGSLGNCVCVCDREGERGGDLCVCVQDLGEVLDGDESKEAASELAGLLQRRLEYLQNPPDCSRARKLVCKLAKPCGFACQMHHLAYCFILAYASERTLVVHDRGWKYSPQGWELVFHPLTPCNASSGKASGTHRCSEYILW